MISLTTPHMFVLPDGRVPRSLLESRCIASVALDLTLQSWKRRRFPRCSMEAAPPHTRRERSSVRLGPRSRLGGGAFGRDHLRDRHDPAIARLAPPTASMAFPRTEHNLTPLPDGTVLVTGGSRTRTSGHRRRVLEASCGRPPPRRGRSWPQCRRPACTLDGMLLPDARVASVAGGGRDFPKWTTQRGDSTRSLLFQGAAAGDHLGAHRHPVRHRFFVGLLTSRASHGVLVRLGSVTHAFNENQRFVPLSFQSTAGA